MDIASRPFFQMAYYVTDLEESVTKWNKIYGAGPFAILYHHKFDTYRYRGKDLIPAERPDLSYALGYLGDTIIQFTTQHDDNPSVYREMYKSGDEGFHHVAFLTGAFDQDVDRLADLGFEVGSQFTGDGVQGAYVDTRSVTASFTEVHSNEQHLLDLFASWKRRHELLKPGESPFIVS